MRFLHKITIVFSLIFALVTDGIIASIVNIYTAIVKHFNNTKNQ